ncbi:hypothetical protein [Schauerella aestuarii]|nr:hypothetical protein [Achromobacter aestuarii]
MNQGLSLVSGIAAGVGVGLALESMLIGITAGIVLAIAFGYRGGRKD